MRRIFNRIGISTQNTNMHGSYQSDVRRGSYNLFLWVGVTRIIQTLPERRKMVGNEKKVGGGFRHDPMCLIR